jgi:CRISPR-associated endonuclease/helicase Cas3
MTYYAHTGEKPDKSDWENLEAHLKRVAEFAQARAAVFDWGAVAYAMGALHDVGKASDDFTKYLVRSFSGEKCKGPDHSTAGAVIALQRYGDGLGKLMAFGVAGHHAGLANGARSGGGASSLKDRLDNAKPFKLPADCDLAAASVEAKAPTEAFAASFLIRMLFSCLVDADRLATEAFEAERKGETVERGWTGELTTLRDRLNAHLDSLRSKGEAVDDIRRDILATVRAGAALDPGLFTLTVPTGGGKTLSSLAFALDHAMRHGMRRVIYVIPFTSVVEQTADVFRAALKDDDAVLEHHSAFDVETFFKDRNGHDDEGAKGEIKLRQAAENWDRPVIVTTAVQFFESLFSHRPSACRKLHAVAGSVVVLDEAQTLPLHVLRPCLAAIQELARSYHTSLVLCTATQPAVHKENGFKDGLQGARPLVPNVSELFEKLHRVTVTRLPEPLADEDLADRLAAEPQVLCIVNNRRHARDLLSLLSERRPADEKIFHLSTCMCAAHRRAELATIKQRLKDKLPTRVVATSLVEAGVDFSFPVVYRAQAGLESVAQAAGRCNRNGELAPDKKGQVFVFDPAPEDNHKPPRELKQFAEIGKAVLAAHLDPLSPDALKAYFKRLYLARTHDELDGLKIGEGNNAIKGVLTALENEQGNDDDGYSHDYPFADIGKAFRLIDSPMVPVIVPYQSADDPERLQAVLGAFSNAPAEKIGGFARRLQPFVVQIPAKARVALLVAESAEAIRAEEFGDQFIMLTKPKLYDCVIGLNWSDPEFLAFEAAYFGK